MQVIKRCGRKELVSFDKITLRLKALQGLLPTLTKVDPSLIAQKVVSGIYDGVTTKELDVLAAETAISLNTTEPEYGTLAARITISNLHKETDEDWETVLDKLWRYINPETGDDAPLISDDCYSIAKKNIDLFKNTLNFDKDYLYDYFGLKTLERSYLVKTGEIIVERPQHMLMRVALGIHKENLAKVVESYELMSDHYYTHATPTLFNAGTQYPQMSSCFLITMKDDSIPGIYSTLKRCAMISKSAGGVGISAHPIRATNSYIRGTGGHSNGIVPMLRVFNDTARYVDQGGGKRKGAFAIYLEPWHADVEAFLELKKNHGKEEQRCRDLFYGMWVPDLFMKRVLANGAWSLFCPNECKGLHDCHGEEFDALYEKYESEGKARKTIKAQDLWNRIVDSQIETGTPYMMYKDACNAKSNQKHLGTIRSSNLCTEIIEYTAPDEIAVCNLASIALPKFVDETNGAFDHQKLFDVVYKVTESLDCVIDENYYPVKEARNSNMRHRPIGMGVQGLADVFCMLRLPYDSPAAKELNKNIFETMYFAAASSSCDLAKRKGAHPSYEGSPASLGVLCPDMWNVKPSDRWDFEGLRKRVKEYGLRNSLLLAPMPTASTSQILGNNECFEPFTSNIYARRVSAGDFTMVNKFLVRDLSKLNLWSETMKNKIIAKDGSVQGIQEIPKDVQKLYRTVWELKMKDLVDMSADRGAFIDQSQSFNAFMATPTKAKVTSMHFYSWRKGLKTGMYYLRTKPAADPSKFTIAPTTPINPTCSMNNDCLSCGS